MNTYEKLNTLIDQAPGVSQWWTSNKRALQWWFIGVMGLALPVFLLTILSFSTTLFAYGSWLIGSLPVDKHWMLISSPLLFTTGMGVIRLAGKLWPKRFTHNEFTLKGAVNYETVSLDFTHTILNRAVKIDDPQMKPILARLRNLKDLDLPKCWWEAFADELNNLTPKDPAIKKSIEEKIDAVYVQIEDVATFKAEPKVLRL